MPAKSSALIELTLEHHHTGIDDEKQGSWPSSLQSSRIRFMHDLPDKPDPSASADAIAGYYNANTKRFLKFGGGGDAAAIHRAIWAPGVQNRTQAFLYLNQLVADALSPLPGDDPDALHLLDLGCGVGGTATWLARTLGIRVTGITLSAEQADMARVHAELLGLANRVDFVLGDFAALPPLPSVQAACAIESFVHAADPVKFFSMSASQIEPGGRLIICDDFLNPPHAARAKRWIRRFAAGWHLNNLDSAQRAIVHAQEAGFCLVEEHNLSPWIRPFNPILLWGITTVTRLPLKWPYWQNLSGGTALQVCLKNGWTEYRALVFERV